MYVYQDSLVAKLAVDPSIPVIQTPEDFDKHCLKPEIACLLAVLAPNPDDEPLESLLAPLIEVKREHHESFTVSYLDATADPPSPFIRLMHDVYGLGDMYPSVFCLNAARGWTSNYRGAFEAAGISGWVKEMQRGKGRVKIDDKRAILGPVEAITAAQESDAKGENKAPHDEL